MKAKPTPGPWTVDRSQIRDANGNALASVPYTLGDEQDRANAHLMASAPAMAETIAQARRHASAALQRLRIAIDYLDENNTQAGRDFAKDAQAELHLAYEAMGGYGHLDAGSTDAERLKAGQAVACALCGRQVTRDDRAATPGDDGRVICGACNAEIR